jgi:hypothetical protein
MRVFLNSGNEDEVVACIAGEMFNLEIGKNIFSGGVENTDPKIRAANYPTFKLSSGTVSIKASYGVLFLRNSNPADHFLLKIKKKIAELTINYHKKEGVCHLQTVSALETGSEQFMLLRTKRNNIDRTYYPTSYLNRKNSISSNQSFTWYIISIEDLLTNVENYESLTVDPLVQLVSILYDKNDMFIYENNTLTLEQISIYKTKAGSRFKDVIFLGEVSVQLMKSIKERVDSLKPITTVVTNSDGSTTEKTELSEEDKYIEAELRLLIHIYKDYRKKPEFILSNYNSSNALILCPIRAGAIEIIRQLGDWSVFQNSFYIDMIGIEEVIYEIDYRDIILSNDRCMTCKTPLYGDIYIMFQDNQSIEGTAVCPVCMHTKFNITAGNTYRQSNLGATLWDGTQTIARAKYPFSVEDIINTMPCDNTVKDILNLSFKKRYFEKHGISKALYLGIDEETKVLPQKIYLAWSGSISQYILSYAGKKKKKNNIPARFPNILEKVVVFSASILE